MVESDNRVPDYDAIAARLREEIGSRKIEYRIVIERQEKIIKEQQENWTILAEAELEGKSYGYPPSRPVVETNCATIFSQIVSELDVASVVKAVNGTPSSGG